MRKTTEEVMEKASDVGRDLVDFWKRTLDGWGDETDQWRVAGHASQAIIDLAKERLDVLKLEDELDHPKSRLILPKWEQ